MGADSQTSGVPVVLAVPPTGGSAARGEDSPSILITGSLLAATLLVGALVIAALGRWRRRLTSVGLSPSDQLAQYRSLYEKGTISQAEFERLRAHLGGRLRQDLHLPSSPRGASAQVQEPPANPAASPDRPPETPDTGIRPA
jgi:hypothetical protein